MSDIDIRLDTADMDRLINQLGDNAETWISGVAEQIVTDVKLSFGTSPPGRVYDRGSGRVHVASRPG